MSFKKKQLQWTSLSSNISQEVTSDTNNKLSSLEEGLSLHLPSLNIIAGMTESGKTNLLKLIIRNNYQSFNQVYVLCPTTDMQDQYSFIDQKYVFKEPTEELIQRIIDRQVEYKERGIDNHIALILDDCIGAVKFQHSDLFDKLASSSRHYKISIFILIQDLKKLSPTLRDNASTLFITHLKEHSVKSAYELSRGFKSERDFKLFLDESCVNYQVVRMNLTAKHKDPHSIIQSIVCPSFILRGRAEFLRILLNYVGQKYTDTRIEVIDDALKERLPFGQLPFYEDGDIKLAQSLTIARYIATKHNIVGKNPVEIALTNQFVESIYDIIVPYFYAKSDEDKEKYKSEIIPSILSRWERALSKNGGKYIVGNTDYTWADLAIFSAVDYISFLGFKESVDKYPTLVSFHQTISQLPQLMTYLESRPVTKLHF